MLLSSSTAATTGGTDILMTFLPIVLVIVAFYFFLIRPQNKKQKKEQQMRNSVRVGDEITTIGGMVGRVIMLKEDFVVFETGNERAKIRIKKWAIQSVVPLDTAEAEEPAKSDTKEVKGKDEKPAKDSSEK